MKLLLRASLVHLDWLLLYFQYLLDLLVNNLVIDHTLLSWHNLMQTRILLLNKRGGWWNPFQVRHRLADIFFQTQRLKLSSNHWFWDHKLGIIDLFLGLTELPWPLLRHPLHGQIKLTRLDAAVQLALVDLLFVPISDRHCLLVGI